MRLPLSQALQLAQQHLASGQLDPAEQICRAVLAAEPTQPQAVACLAQIASARGNLDLLNDLGVLYLRLAQYAEALPLFQRAVQLRPTFYEARGNLAKAHHALGQLMEAIPHYEAALALRPNSLDLLNNLAAAYGALGQADDAETWCLRASQLQPHSPDIASNLGMIYQAQGRIEEAVAAYRQSFELAPSNPGPLSNALWCEHYRQDVTLARLQAAHAQWQARFAAPLKTTWLPHPNSRDPQRPLRLGFVSADFSLHAVGIFLLETLRALPPLGSETVCYASQTTSDPITAVLRSAANRWQHVAGLPDEALAAQIRADRIDILFDLSGHTGGHRLGVFARKPAPIQATWIGYMGTTGLDAIDYLIADRHQVPAGSEPFYAEEVLRLPDGYVTYSPPPYAPPVSPLPAQNAGRVTFGCFNNPAKINPGVIRAWAKILNRLPYSRLVLHFRGLDGPRTGPRFRALFAQHGVDPGRIELCGVVPHPQLLAHYQQIDLALDTFPYSGGLTTCEALWMGVPVITCPGETFASRHSLSHLTTAGLSDTVAADLDDYVERAVAWASDVKRLDEVRSNLRPQMAASPLCDGSRLASNLMQLLRHAWRRWCAQ